MRTTCLSLADTCHFSIPAPTPLRAARPGRSALEVL
jgi:hypothetical protein